MKLFQFFSLIILLLATGCSSTPSKELPSQETVDHVDLQRFMGKWYVIASIPTSAEKDAVNATETYTWNAKEERVDIDFRFRQGSASGEEKIIPQKGFIENKETNAEWRVQPFWPLKFAYLIVDLAPDYSDTIIGRPGRENVWVLAREPRMSDVRYRQLMRKIEAWGYEVKELKKVPQDW
ncbi:MAG: lipocalin family protein [Bacteriovoracia bacterium]